MPGNNDVNLAVKNVYSNFHKLRKSAYENRISTYYKINNPNELKIALYKHGPVAAGIKIYDNFSIPNNIYHYDKTQPTSGHAVMIIGWTKKYWIVQNSWGKDWGDKGKFFIPIDKSFKEVFFEAYGVTDNIFSIKTPNKIIKKYNKPINKIINSFEKIKNFCYNIYRKENVL